MDIPTIEERQERLGDDLVWGANGIAEELRVSIHKARYLVHTGKMQVSRSPGSREYFTTIRALRKVFRGPAV
jgi:hypothetical protein